MFRQKVFSGLNYEWGYEQNATQPRFDPNRIQIDLITQLSDVIFSTDDQTSQTMWDSSGWANLYYKDTGSVSSSSYFKYNYVTTFAWTHNQGATSAFPPVLPDNFYKQFDSIPTNSCLSSIPILASFGNYLYSDGAFGSSGNPYDLGIANTIIGCETDLCSNRDCKDSPVGRLFSAGFKYLRASGRWSMTNGLMNSCRLGANFAIRSFLGNPALETNTVLNGAPYNSYYSQLYNAYGPLQESSTYDGQLTTENAGNLLGESQKSVLAEGISIFNNYYYSVDKFGACYPTDYTELQLVGGPYELKHGGYTYSNPIGPEFDRDTYDPDLTIARWYGAGPANNPTDLNIISQPGSTGFYQVSRWYVPSINELAFIAHKTRFTPPPPGETQNLRQKIIGAGGIAMGALSTANGNLVSSNTSNSWVWSSTAAFDTTKPDEYIQSSTNPLTNEDSNPSNPNGVTDRMTQAWAIQFTPNPANQRVAKKNNTNFYAELRPIRIIRCDQQFYKNSDPDIVRNGTWFVPRFSDALITSGTNSTKTGTLPNKINTQALYNPESDIYKNYNPTNNPLL
jgi:hypothetical protein